MSPASPPKGGEEVRAVDQAGADWIDIDIMDGRFAPNISVGPAIVNAVRPSTAKPLNVHLMIVEPERYVGDFVKAGADDLPVPQKLTLWECCEPASIRMLASAQDTLSLPDFRINGLDLGMLEARSLQSVSQLDELELVALEQGSILVDVHNQLGYLAGELELPVAVFARRRNKVDHKLLALSLVYTLASATLLQPAS